MHAIDLRRGCAALGLAAAALLCAVLPAAADEPLPTAYSEDDLRLLYDEAAALGADGYDFYLHISDDEDAMRKLDARLNADPKKRAPLTSVLPALRPQKMRAFAMAAPLRERLRELLPGESTALFKADGKRWAIAELRKVEPDLVMPTLPQLRATLPRLARVGALPPPARLRSDAELRERALLARVGSVREFDQLPPGTDIERPLASGHTLLQRALQRDQPDLVRAVLTAGADPNRCPLHVCPLQLALQSRTHALTYVNLLLDRGARPDLLSRMPGQNTALVQAALTGRLDLAKALLAKGADPEGGPSLRQPLAVALEKGDLELLRLLLDRGADANGRKLATSPLHTALATDNRELAQLLLDHGADPLQQRPLPGGVAAGAPLLAAVAAQKAELAAWFRAAALKKLGAQGAYRWSAWVEQEVLAPRTDAGTGAGPLVQIIKTPLRPGGRVLLNRERFTLHLRLPPQGLRVEASTGPQLAAELGAGNLIAPLFSRARLRKGGAKPAPLLVSDGRARAAGAGGILTWTPTAKDCDQLQKDAEGTVCVRIIDALRLDNGSGATEVPLERTRMAQIELVLGVGIDYSETVGDLVNALPATLAFK